MKLARLIMAGAIALAATPVFAAGMVSAKDPKTVLDALSQLGYPGKIEKLES
jgi:hypothetical protein